MKNVCKCDDERNCTVVDNCSKLCPIHPLHNKAYFKPVKVL